MRSLVYAFPGGGGGPLPAFFGVLIVVVLVAVVLGRAVHDRLTRADRNRPGETTLDRLNRRHLRGLSFMALIAGIVVLVILIANAHTPCSRAQLEPNGPVFCK